MMVKNDVDDDHNEDDDDYDDDDDGDDFADDNISKVANLLRLFRIPQISPASTAKALSDKTKFVHDEDDNDCDDDCDDDDDVSRNLATRWRHLR